MTSELELQTGASRDDVLPGYVLSAPGLAEIGAAESTFARQHVRDVEVVYASLSPERYETKLDATLAAIRAGEFQYGGPSFDVKAQAGGNLALLLYWCLRVKQPDVTPDRAGTLLAAQPAYRQASVIDAVLSLWGFGRKKKATDPAGPGSPLTGG